MSKRPSAIYNDPGYFYSRRGLGKLFLFSSVLMLVGLVWMVFFDFDRLWKDEQRAHQKWEARKLAFEGLILESRAGAAQEKLDKRLKKANKAIAAKKKELEELEAEIADAEGAFYRATMAYNEQKQYTIQAEWHVHEAQSAKELEKWEKEFVKQTDKEHRLRDARQKADARLQALLAQRKEAYKAIDQIVEETRSNPAIKKLDLVNASKERKRAYNPAREIPLLDFLLPPTKVEQVVLDDIVDDYEFARPKKVDRCATCHIGSTKLGFELAKWPIGVLTGDVKKPTAAFESGIYRVVYSLLESVWKEKVDPTSPTAHEDSLVRSVQIHHATLDTLFQGYDPETGEIPLQKINIRVDGEMQEVEIKKWKRYTRKGKRWVEDNKNGTPIDEYYRGVLNKLEGKGHWLTHPHFDDMVGSQSPHPYEKVGCSICHQGRGWSTDFGRAWHKPNRIAATDGEGNANWMTEDRAHADHKHLPRSALYPLGEAMRIGAFTAYQRKAWDTVTDLTMKIADASGDDKAALEAELATAKANPHYASARKKAASLREGYVTDKATKKRWAEELGRNKTKLKYWHWPQHSKMLVQSSCLKCHKEGLYRTAPENEYGTLRLGRPVPLPEDLYQWEDHSAAANPDIVADPTIKNRMLIPEKPPAYRPRNLERGLDNFMRFGCYGCHKIDEKKYPFMKSARPKVGPPLDGLVSKTNAKWTRKWLRNPKDYRPETRMPRFWGLSNNSHDFNYRFADTGFEKGVNGKDWAEAEMYAITAWLYAESRKRTKAIEADWKGGDAARGEKLFLADGQKTDNLGKGCVACHDIGDGKSYGADKIEEGWEGRMSRRQGPNLDGIGSKLDPAWLYDWLKNPRNYWHDTNMPDLRLTDQEAKDLVAYLMSLRHADFDALPDVGLNLSVIDRIATELKVAEQKESTTEAIGIIKKWRDEYNDRPAGEKGEDPIVMYVGDKLVKHYGCFGCHTIDSYKDATPIGAELTEWGSKLIDRLEYNHAPIEKTRFDFAYTKMRNPRIYDYGMPRRDRPFERLKMPRFVFTKEEARDIATFMVALVNDPITAEAMFNPSKRQQTIIRGRQIVARYNCQACHKIEGEGGDIWPTIENDKWRPPDLLGQGFKTQPDWLFKYFKNPAFVSIPGEEDSDRVRPWHSIRMPTFHFTDEEASALVRYFEALSGIDDGYKTPPPDELAGKTYDTPIRLKLKDPVDKTKSYTADVRNPIEEARALFQELQCKSCHAKGADILSAAPDFRHTRAGRLREAWLETWLWNPSRLQVGTAMPTFWANEQGPVVQDKQFFKHGGGPDTQADRQILALRDYIRHHYREEDR